MATTKIIMFAVLAHVRCTIAVSDADDEGLLDCFCKVLYVTAAADAYSPRKMRNRSLPVRCIYGL